MGNIHVKLYQIWTSGSGEDSFKEKSLHKTIGDAGQRPTIMAHTEPSSLVI